MKRCTLFALATLFVFSGVSAQVPFAGLVGWYPFNGNAHDATGNGNNATVVQASLAMDRFGVANAAYSFNGTSDAIKMEGLNSFMHFNNLNDSYTVVVWVKSADPNTGSTSCRILEHSSAVVGAQGYPFSIQVNNASNAVSELIWDGTTISTAPVTGTVFDNSWRMITMKVDNTQDSVYAYLDNALVSVVSNDLSLPSQNSDTLVVGNVRNGSRPYAGLIDDIRIYNRALSAAEIDLLFNEGLCYQTITDTVLVSVTDTLVIDAVLSGIPPPNNINTLKIYPNPAHDHITVDYGNFSNMAGYTLKITNSLSQVVFTTPITQQSSFINLSSWSGNGIYFVHLIDAQSNTLDIRKIVLQ